MKKFIAGFLAVWSIFTTNMVLADNIRDADQERNGYVFVDPNLKTPFVKELPESFKKQLGSEYILVRKDFLKELDYRAQKSAEFEQQINDMVADIKTHRTHIAHLEDMLKGSYNQIETLNGYIDVQQKEIERLQPTMFSRNKFVIGMALGIILSGGAMYGASKIIDK